MDLFEGILARSILGVALVGLWKPTAACIEDGMGVFRRKVARSMYTLCTRKRHRYGCHRQNENLEPHII
jgi:hypothetical protein